MRKIAYDSDLFFLTKFESMLRAPFAAIPFALALSAASHADFNADIGIGSEYLKDGISQSRGQVVGQAGLTYHNDLGLYGGVWGSNIDQRNNSAHSELSGFAGWYLPLTSGLALDAGLTHYRYQGDAALSDNAYDEGFAKILIDDAWMLGWRHAEDYLGSEKARRSLETAYTLQTETFSIEFYLAQNRYLEIDADTNYGNNRDDYWHVRFGLERSYNNWDYRLKLERTNLGSRFDAGTAITFSMHRYFNF